MKLWTYASPSHEPFLEEFLRPSSGEFSLHVARGEQAGSGIYGAEDWVESERGKIKAMLDACQEPNGTIVVWSDADVQLFAPCVDRLLEVLGTHDMAVQNNAGGGCAGFFVFRCNARTRALFKTIASDNTLHGERDDQVCMNENLGLVNWTLLPKDEFWSIGVHLGWRRWLGDEDTLRQIGVPETIRVHHANWCVGFQEKLRLLYRVRDVVWARQGKQVRWSPAFKEGTEQRRRLRRLSGW